MRIDLNRYIRAFKSLPPPVKEAEVQAEMFDEILVGSRSGELRTLQNYVKTAYYVRVTGEKTGTAYTERMDEDPHEVIVRALANSEYASDAVPARMHPPYPAPLRIIDDEQPEGVVQLWGTARELEKIASGLDCRVKRVSDCWVRKTTRRSRVVNSKGLDTYLENTYFKAVISVVAYGDGGKVCVGKAETTSKKLSGINLEDLARRAVGQATIQIGKQTEVNTGVYDAVLSNVVTRNILATAWQEFVGTYMVNGSSIYKGEIGERIGSTALSITDAPEHPMWGYNQAVDCEGTVCEKKAIVKEGRLVTPLHNLESAARAGHRPTGNAGRSALMSGSVPVNIITVPAVLYIEPGEDSVEKLTEKMGDGIYLTYSLDTFHSINIASGEFAIPCGGVVYRGGEKVGVVDQLTMVGNVKDLFTSIERVANDLTFEEFIGKSYSYGGPSLLVRQMKFAGRGAG